MQTTPHRSLTVVFRASIVGDDDPDEPTRGLATAEFLKRTLTDAGWTSGELDVRYGSWFFVASRGETRLEIVLGAALDDIRYGLVAPEEEHGFFGGLKHSHATPSDVLVVARLLHAALVEPNFRHQRWAWDNEPNDASPSEPPAIELATARRSPP